MFTAKGEQANKQMVDRLIAQGALWSSAVIEAFRATPRHCFLDRVYLFQEGRGWRGLATRGRDGPNELRLLYSDRALITRVTNGNADGEMSPISSSSQPSLMAQMLEDLRLTPGLHVLEIGAGTGYNAALMAHVVGPERVHSVDVDRRVLAEAEAHLERFQDRGVILRHTDGREGLVAGAPWDRIMATAATPDLEPAWLEQLGEGGILQAPLALAPGLSFLVQGTMKKGFFEGRLTRTAYFMPLRGERETGRDHEIATLPTSTLRAVAPPWAEWVEVKKLRDVLPNLVQALAFYGFLRGLKVTYQTLPTGPPVFSLQDPASGAVCWLGPRSWSVEEESGVDLGRTLWQAFLDAGGPRPTEFRLRISLSEILSPGPGRECHVVHGPRYRQVWEMIEPRDRLGWR